MVLTRKQATIQAALKLLQRRITRSSGTSGLKAPRISPLRKAKTQSRRPNPVPSSLRAHQDSEVHQQREQRPARLRQVTPPEQDEKCDTEHFVFTTIAQVRRYQRFCANENVWVFNETRAVCNRCLLSVQLCTKGDSSYDPTKWDAHSSPKRCLRWSPGELAKRRRKNISDSLRYPNGIIPPRIRRRHWAEDAMDEEMLIYHPVNDPHSDEYLALDGQPNTQTTPPPLPEINEGAQQYPEQDDNIIVEDEMAVDHMLHVSQDYEHEGDSPRETPAPDINVVDDEAQIHCQEQPVADTSLVDAPDPLVLLATTAAMASRSPTPIPPDAKKAPAAPPSPSTSADVNCVYDFNPGTHGDVTASRDGPSVRVSAETAQLLPGAGAGPTVGRFRPCSWELPGAPHRTARLYPNSARSTRSRR